MAISINKNSILLWQRFQFFFYYVLARGAHTIVKRLSDSVICMSDNTSKKYLPLYLNYLTLLVANSMEIHFKFLVFAIE